MRYSASFIASLFPEGRAILTRGAANIGAIPIIDQPGIGGANEGFGVVWTAGVSTPASITSIAPSATGASYLRFPRIEIVSGLTAGSTAGRFGMPDGQGRIFCPSVGWCAHWMSQGALPLAENRGGDMMGWDFAADGSFEPPRLQRGRGWVKGSGAASTWRWYQGTPDTTFACTGTAPCDDRLYDHVMAEVQQDVSGTCYGYALKVDLSDLDNPVIADQRRYVIPTPASPVGLERNRSPIAGGTAVAAVTLNDYGFQASIGVTQADINAVLSA